MGKITRLPKHSKGKGKGKQHVRNPRVRKVSANEWITGRKAKLDVSLKYAAAAKSYRTALGVTQSEMGHYHGVTYSSVCRWESGFYFGWTDVELSDYIKDCEKIAGIHESEKKASHG